MVKKILLFSVVCLGFLYSSCSGAFSLGSLVPWYTPWVKDKIDRSDMLTQEYLSRPVYARAIAGPEKLDSTTLKTWVVVAQDRQPNASKVVILDSDFQRVFTFESYDLGEPRATFVDPRGYIQMGSVEVQPPSAGNSDAWTVNKSDLTGIGFPKGQLLFSVSKKSTVNALVWFTLSVPEGAVSHP